MKKLCECGCGLQAPIASRNEKRKGLLKGDSMRFIHNHHLKIQKRTHGHTVGHRDSPEYAAYVHAKMRCNNLNDAAYHNYGGRGIQFLFGTFEEFLSEVGLRPSNGYSLDRYPNNDGNYEKGNLRWATRKQQNSNKRSYRKLITRFSNKELLDEVRRRGINIIPD